MNGYETVDKHVSFKWKDNSITKGHNAALANEQRRLYMRKESFLKGGGGE